MKLVLKLLSFALLCSLAMPLQAAEKFKVAVVDMKAAINLSSEGKKSTQYFQSQAQKQEQKFRAKGEQIQKQQKALENNLMLSESARAQKMRELNQAKRALQKEVQAAQQDYRKEEMKHLQRISQELALAVKTIGEREGYDLVIEATVRQTLLYTRFPVNDITEQVVREYNKMKNN